jgi:uncharacterized membrane protein YphA (DoxX/SURF4 family)
MWVIFSIIVVACAAILHAFLPDWGPLVRFARAHKSAIDHVAQLVLGVFLVATAFFWNVIILPSESVTTPLLITLKYIEIAIGFMFITHVASRYAAAGLLILTLVITFSQGLEAVLENVILMSLAFYFYLMHTPVSGIWVGIKKYAVDIVRIGTGVSLIALACTEKLLYPELGMQFLVEHHWNFMQPFFPWFSDELFVLSTGCAEMLFGIVFILGYVTRITTVTIALFFFASVTTMFYQAHIWEVEDFVVYCSAILLFFFSHGHTTLPDLVRKLMRAKNTSRT